jgi:protein-S-isoprenylcysteine O-methyltransferase Ste14
MMEPRDPEPMSRIKAVIYAVSLPLGLFLLVFLPAGSIFWRPGWVFLAVLVFAFGVSALIIWRVNPVIYRARSRFQPGTKGWDKTLLAIMLPAMVAILPVAAMDSGRFHWSRTPGLAVLLGYGLVLAGIAGTGWAQAVNPFFEPGVRIQAERHQHVIDSGPYGLVRHPGYIFAILLFCGMALALASWWALVPAMLATALLILRTSWEDRLLQSELPGYSDYAARTRWRLVPGIW